MLIRRTALLAAFAMMFQIAQASDLDVDLSFGSSGWLRLFENGGGTQDEHAVGFARTADGGYVVAGDAPGGGANGGTGKRIALYRLDHDGQFVNGFGTQGKVFKDAWLSSVTDMAIDAQGRIVVVGATPGQGGLGDFGVVRFNADGSDDTSFAGDGGMSFGFDVSGADIDDAPTSVLVDPDGRIVVAGNYTFGSNHAFSVVRLNTDGSVDSSFGSIDDGAGGRRGSHDTFVDNAGAYASRILRIADGYYVITGTSVFSSTDTDFAARILTPTGSQWSSFAGSAIFPIDEPGAGGSLFDSVNDAILIDPTTILLIGTASGKFAATRIIAGTNGSNQYATLTTDPSFVGSAIDSRPNRYVGSTSNADCRSATVRADGRMLLVGGTSSFATGSVEGMDDAELQGNSWVRVALATRLLANGSPDASYGNGGNWLFVAPGGSGPSFYSTFERVRYDGANAVAIGSSVDNSSAVFDFDGIVVRFAADLIFANGFD
jgi:uncharacterized delta-60 repeat protein